MSSYQSDERATYIYVIMSIYIDGGTVCTYIDIAEVACERRDAAVVTAQQHLVPV